MGVNDRLGIMHGRAKGAGASCDIKEYQRFSGSRP